MKNKTTKTVLQQNITRLKRRLGAINVNRNKAIAAQNLDRLEKHTRAKVATEQDLKGLEVFGIEGMSAVWEKAGSDETSFEETIDGLKYRIVENGAFTFAIRNGEAYVINPFTGELEGGKHVGY